MKFFLAFQALLCLCVTVSGYYGYWRSSPWRSGSLPCACPKIYSPVCGIDGQTYTNECIANCNGVEVATYGECEIFEDGFYRYISGGGICPPKKPSWCPPKRYDYVCADGWTHENACWACKRGHKRWTDGAC